MGERSDLLTRMGKEGGDSVKIVCGRGKGRESMLRNFTHRAASKQWECVLLHHKLVTVMVVCVHDVCGAYLLFGGLGLPWQLGLLWKINFVCVCMHILYMGLWINPYKCGDLFKFACKEVRLSSKSLSCR